MKLLQGAVLALILGSPLLFSCNKSNSSGQAEPALPPQPTKVASLKQRRAIVFVHGIHGTSDDTWKVPPSGPNWPDLMKADIKFDDAKIFTIGYPSPFTGNKKDIGDIANDLAGQLKPIFDSYDQVFFICHSLGGLVVEKMLLKHQELAKQVPAIVFYATPHGASVVAAYASVFLNDPLLEEMQQEGGDGYIFNLAQDWHKAAFSIHSYCVYENEKMRPHDLKTVLVGGTPDAASKLLDFIGGIYVVTPVSATYGCDNNNLPFEKVDANHINIVKPPAKDVGAYALFTKYYSLTQAPQKPEEQFVTYDKVVCATYGEANQQQPAWNNDFHCPVPEPSHLDPGYRQPPGSSAFAGGHATTDMTTASVPAGFDVIADGAYYWSVKAPSFDGNTFILHTYCGPSGGYEGGCNVKAKIVAHYKVNVTNETAHPAQ
jgi:pimeloyl-ACP methyl ester carboxylesterase